MTCALPGIASGIGIDPTLPRDGTDFITLEGVIRIHVWLRLCCAALQRREIPLNLPKKPRTASPLQALVGCAAVFGCANA
jgi:hypothetical protein